MSFAIDHDLQMATESEALFNKAKTGLRRVETVDRTKENPSLGRVLGAEERPEFRTSTVSNSCDMFVR